MINALWIDDRDFFGDDPEDAIDAVAYGEHNVIGGEGAFSTIVQDFGGFSTAVAEKIATEITPVSVPEPGSISMLILGMLSIMGYAVKRKK